jgi:hypothetical protein
MRVVLALLLLTSAAWADPFKAPVPNQPPPEPNQAQAMHVDRLTLCVAALGNPKIRPDIHAAIAEFCGGGLLPPQAK